MRWELTRVALLAVWAVRDAVPRTEYERRYHARTWRQWRPRAMSVEPMASKGLTECWREAMAAKPSTWKLMGVACGPREADPNIHSAEVWSAWARGPDRERLEGGGSGPHDALMALTVQLRELSG